LLLNSVYVIVNEDDTIYVGQTNNLERRLLEHNSKNGHFTGNKGIWRVIYKEEFENRSFAIKRENELKSSRGRNWIRTELLGRASVD